MSKYLYPLKQTLRFIGNQNKKISNNVKQHSISIYSNCVAMYNINYINNFNDYLRTNKASNKK